MERLNGINDILLLWVKYDGLLDIIEDHTEKVKGVKDLLLEGVLFESARKHVLDDMKRLTNYLLELEYLVLDFFGLNL